MLADTVVAGDAVRLDEARQGLSAASSEFDRAVGSVLDASRLEWSGAASEAHSAVLDTGVQLIHRMNDAVLAVAVACSDLSAAVEQCEAEIADAVGAQPSWPTAPPPLPADADPVDEEIHRQLRWRYEVDVDEYHRLVDRQQGRIDSAQADLQTARQVFADACAEATNHLFASSNGVHWSWDRNLMSQANTDLADAFATGDTTLINSQAQVAGSTYALSFLSRGLWNAVTGTGQMLGDMVEGAGNAVWDALESIGTGFGMVRPVDPEPHFDLPQVTVEPAYPLDDANRAMTVAAEVAWSVAIAGGTKAAVDELLLRSDNRALLEMLEFMRALRGDTGMYGVASLTARQADALGEIWVGPGFRIASDGRTFVSADELRQYRPPSWKKDLGVFQANFEWRPLPHGSWLNNGHAVIVDLP